MAGTRKLGKPTDQRLAMLKTQTTDVLLNGKIRTTEARAKEVKALVDSIIALAVKEKDNFEEVEVKVVKAKLDSKGHKFTEKATSKNGKEYLKKNYPSLYEKQKEEIEKLGKRYQYDYLMYDASNTIDRFINIAKQAKNITKVTNKVGIKAFQEMEKSNVLDIFLNSMTFLSKK